MLKNYGPPVLLFGVLVVVGLRTLAGPPAVDGAYPVCQAAPREALVLSGGGARVQIEPACWTTVRVQRGLTYPSYVYLDAGRNSDVWIRAGSVSDSWDEETYAGSEYLPRWGRLIGTIQAGTLNSPAVQVRGGPATAIVQLRTIGAEEPQYSVCPDTVSGLQLVMGENKLQLHPDCWSGWVRLPSYPARFLIHNDKDMVVDRQGFDRGDLKIPGGDDKMSIGQVSTMRFRGDEVITVSVSPLSAPGTAAQADARAATPSNSSQPPRTESAAQPPPPTKADAPSASAEQAGETVQPPAILPPSSNQPAKERAELFHGYPLCPDTQLTTVRPLGPNEVIRVELRPNCWSDRIFIPREVEEQYDIFVESETSFEKHVLYDNGSSIVLPDWTPTIYMLPSFRLRGTTGTVKITMRRSR